MNRQAEQWLRGFEERYLDLSSGCREWVEAQKEGENGQKEGLKRQVRDQTYDQNLWLYPSEPTTWVETAYDLRESKVLGLAERLSNEDNHHLTGINSALERAIRLDDASKGERHAKSKVSTGGARALRSERTLKSRKGKGIDTSSWLDEVEKGLQGADLCAQAPGLRQSVWCNSPTRVEEAQVAELEREREGDAEAEAAPTTSGSTEDASGEGGSGGSSSTVSFTQVFTGSLSTALNDFIQVDDEEDSQVLEGEDLGDDEDTRGKFSYVSSGNYVDDAELEELMEHLDNQENFWYQAKVTAEQAKDKKRWAISERLEDIDEAYEKTVTDPAMTFPFKLDAFQKEAIVRMERNESVFVAAHTSAGKTVVAEYAFALASKHCSRAVYTSPIKTISNQKFRDFTDNGFDVGLLTGDVSINPEASSLIMTTEILRSMLYRGANMIRDIEWVIFDEVHYINDIERGVVWEEVIIMLPETVSIVCLSATVPNVVEFADWIGRTKRKNIYITGTLKRPVPLEHYLHYQGEDFKVCEGHSFSTAGFKLAADAYKKAHAPKQLPPSNNRNKNQRGGPNSQHRPQQRNQQQRNQQQHRHFKGHSLNNERTQLSKLLASLQKKDLLPTIIFAFSKKRCDLLADYVRSKDMTTSQEKHDIHIFCNKSFSRLTGTDRKLPQITRVEALLMRGIGVHHSGLLPIVREVVEMLFCKGVVKILFATETFAMGVNAPARAVVFHSLRKHDGQSFRSLLSGEYTQMAGRAGRRGLDKFGTVIVACWDKIPGELELKKLLTGSATRLKSQFRLTYNMILNLLRVDEMKIEEMIRRSFQEFHAQAALPNTKALLKKANLACSSLDMIDWPLDTNSFSEDFVHQYALSVNQASAIAKNLMGKVQESHALSTIFPPGRPILHYQDSAGDVPQVGLVCSVKTATQAFGGLTKSKKKLVVFVLHHKSMPTTETVNRLEETKEKLSKVQDRSFPGQPQMLGPNLPVTLETGGHIWSLVEVDMSEILCVMKGSMGSFDSKAVLSNQEDSIMEAIKFLLSKSSDFFGGEEMMVSAKSDLKLQDIDDIQSYLKLSEIVATIQSYECNSSNRLFEQFRITQAKLKIGTRISELRHKLSDASLHQMPEFHQRVRVLQNFGYIDDLLLVKMKGRVACEIQSCDELLATEMIFRGMLSSLKPEEAIALISSLVFQDKSESGADIPEILQQKSDDLVALALEVGEIQEACQMLVTPEDYVKSCLNFGLLQVVYEWASGLPFSKICEHTDVMEGSIVRTIIRLEETCREFKDAARVMGDPHLLKLMEDASFLIKRDVIFAASLYVA